MDEKTIKAIEAIIKRGSDAKVRRKGDRYVVLEVKATIKYSPPAIVSGEGQYEPVIEDFSVIGSFLLSKS